MTVFAGVVVAPASAAGAATSCAPTLLPTPAGATTVVEVVGTDGNGAYAGVVRDDAGDLRGVVWRNGAAELLADDFIPTDVNSDGLMTGSVYYSNPNPPFEEYQYASVRPLDGPVVHMTLGYRAYAQGLNESGDVVGKVITGPQGDYINAAWYAPEREMSSMPGRATHFPSEIDDTGVIIGTRVAGGQVAQAIWTTEGAGTEILLREYGPYWAGQTAIELADLDDGTVVADRTTPDGTRVVITIDARSGSTVVVPDSTGGTPYEINDGTIVGRGPAGAMMWRAGEAVVLPAAPATTTRRASAVNDTGTEIGGLSARADGTVVATVWDCSA